MRLVAFFLVSVAVVSAQAPTFEVASVKLNIQRSGVRGHSFSGNRFEATNVPLGDLILVAYGEPGQLLPDVRVSNAPSWTWEDRFDVSAKVGGDSPNAVAQKQMMLRSLLAERFKLAIHTEPEDRPIYSLVRARSRALGPQLHHADVDCEPLLATQPGRRDRCILYALPNGTLMVRGQTMSALANVLTMLLNRVVRDQTGLTGGFDADAEFNPEGLPGMNAQAVDANRGTDLPSLFVVLQERLGLKLEATTGPVDVLVIDHVERPTPN
jgi:uncharacterized protein (TIGR03435 family)